MSQRQPNKKFLKKRDRHEVTSQSNPVKVSLLEARISIHINDEMIIRSQYETIIRELCSQFGEVKTIHIPDKCKKGNLVFVEFADPRAADKAIKCINADRALHMIANQARAPKARMNVENNVKPSTSSFQENFTPRQPFTQTNTSPRNKNVGDLNDKENVTSWRSPRNAEQNRLPSNGSAHNPRGSKQSQNGSHNGNASQIHSKAIEALIPTAGHCNLCHRPAELKCQRCGDFYCSHLCQKVHWPQHKRFCFPMPDLVPAEEIPTNGASSMQKIDVPQIEEKLETIKLTEIEPQVKNLSPKFDLPLNVSPPRAETFQARPQLDHLIVYCDEDPKSGDIVAITHPVSTNRVYIVHNQGKMAEEYRSILTWASREENHGPRFMERPDKGTLVFAEFENDWYRAVVQKVIDAQHVLVAFFDFGNTEQLHYTKLREYTGEGDTVRYTYSIYLKDCPYNVGNPMPKNVLDYLKKFSDEFTPLKIRYNGEFNKETNVELFVAETDVCINDKVCALLGTSRAEVRKNREIAKKKIDKQNEPDNREKFYYDDLRFERMDTENKNRIIILCSDDLETNSIWCCLKAANCLIKEIDDAVNNFAENGENLVSFLPEKNELCLVKRNDTHYERAVLVEIDDEKARVMSVDYGGFYFVTKDCIFKIDKSLLMPYYTHVCRISGFPSLIEGDLYNFLKEELEGESNEFVVNKITYDDEDEVHVLFMSALLNEAIACEYLTDDTLTESSHDS
uniref:CSON005141 protein n=1 Tax=Culicoides sonorensis TaxID=179676 RepID=A0A336LV32_CULSO